MITTTDPRTGVVAETGIEPTDIEDVREFAINASIAAAAYGHLDRNERALLLNRIADAIEAEREMLVSTAEAETGLESTRLSSELTRSAAQFRLFADAVREGGFLETAIDHAAHTPMGEMPDIRRMLVPLGPVAVFGSSNFPFAFSILGGDTASALAAGCPVILKAHSAHPLTSARSFAVLDSALQEHDSTRHVAQIVYGQDAGISLVKAPEVSAAAFTGSIVGARALMTAIDGRPDPIPFYGELSSVNPLIVTPLAAKERAEEIASGLYASFTGSAGQLCTKPGIAFVPAGKSGDRIVAGLVSRAESSAPLVLLNGRVHESFTDAYSQIESSGARVLARGAAWTGPGIGAPPVVLQIDAAQLSAQAAAEAFGPLVLIARYEDMEHVVSALRSIPSSLTVTLHTGRDESTQEIADLARLAAAHSGRIIFNGYPTGVRVGWAQHHGGPWPATNTLHTSVGVTAMRRFLRPLAWQNAPQHLLPRELRDGHSTVPRRIDGVLHTAESGARPDPSTF